MRSKFSCCSREAPKLKEHQNLESKKGTMNSIFRQGHNQLIPWVLNERVL